MSEPTYDCIIVGAGLSGLSAASTLHRRGLSVLILEARERAGGRTCSPQYDGHVVDLGGAYVGPTQDRILDLAKQVGVELYPVNTDGNTLMHFFGKPKHYTGVIPPLGPLELLDFNNLLVEGEKLAYQVPVDAPWNAPRAAELDNMTVQTYIDKSGWTRYAKKLYEASVRALLCAAPSEVSLLFWLWYVRMGGGIVRLSECKNGAQECKFKGGSQQISDLVAKQLGDRVKFDHPLSKIAQHNNCVTVTCRNGATFSGSYLITAMSPALLSKIEFEPKLPPLKTQLIQRFPVGSIIKTVTYYKTPFWRTEDFNGLVITDQAPVSVSYDDSDPSGKWFALMGFITSSNARVWIERTEDERRDAIAKEYAVLFKSDLALAPCGYVEKRWMDEEWSGGCYVGYTTPGTLTGFGHVLREPFINVHFAGTETATKWMGYMDGAVQAGQRAATEILIRMNKMTAIGAQEFMASTPASKDLVPLPTSPTAFEKCLPGVPVAVVSSVVLLVSIFVGLYHRYT